MTTDTDSIAELLGGSAKTIAGVVDQIDSVQALADIARRESGGQRRSGVLNHVQNRIGALMVEQGPEAAGVGVMSREDQVIAEQPDVVETREDIMSVAGNAEVTADGSPISGGAVTHRTARKVVMYFPQKGVGYLPRLIPRTNQTIVLQNGAKAFCPDCRRQDCSWTLLPNGQLLIDPNDCTARPQRKFARCPVCRRTLYDLRPVVGQSVPDTGEVDPNEIDMGAYESTTPEARLKVRVNHHMAAAHPDEAESLGIPVNRTPERTGGRPTLAVVQT